MRSRFESRLLVERYRLLGALGTGGLGRVIEGEIVRTGMPVAVKMLHPLLARDHEARARLERECALVAKVDHDGLVPILDIDCDGDGTPFLVMELLRGTNLREKLDAEKVLSIRDAIWIAWHVADTLAAVHEAEVVHRNLKPENIFLQCQRHVPVRVRLLDFGMARAREKISGDQVTITSDGHTLGSPAYLSPEQARGDEALDRLTDVYALGVVLYEMLAGQSPYPGAEHASPVVMLQIIREREAIPLRHLRPDATRSLELFLARALAKSRPDRVASMEEFIAQLSAIAAEPLPGAPVTDLEWGDDQRHGPPSSLSSIRSEKSRGRGKKPRKSSLPPLV